MGTPGAFRLTLTVCLALFVSTKALAQGVTVFAAASLTDALQQIEKAWRASGGAAVKFSFAASSTLARQIESGAEADIFASADEQWMDYLEQRNRVAPGTRRSRLGNSLVLVAPAGASRKVELGKGVDLLALAGDGRIATGDPAHVPVGRYAQQALTWLGLWDKVGPRLARTDNVRAALVFVERGEAPFGIVYGTDAAASGKVQVAGVFPAESHAPISYPFAIVAKRGRPEVQRFFEFLQGPEATAIFRQAGFTIR